jgi:tRNA G18 (ribose-2'-O)-methylase SpoU
VHHLKSPENVGILGHCRTDDEFFAWCERNEIAPVAVEIASPPAFLPGDRFPERSVLVLGNEGAGLPPDVLSRCAGVVTIPQHGPVPCLNVAVAGSIAMYELVRAVPVARAIAGDEYMVGTGETSGA